MDRGPPANKDELPLPRLQRLGNHRIGGDQPTKPDLDVRVEAFGAHALGEGGEDGDLLVELRLLDERPAATGSMEVALVDEVQEGLADGGQTDAELIAVLTLAGQLLGLAKLAAREPAQEGGRKLGVDR